MLHGIGEYLAALLSAWRSLFAFGPFLLDYGLPMIWPAFAVWTANNLPPDRKKSFLKGTVLFTFVLANYLAFSAERTDKEKALGDLRSANARLISADQIPITFRAFTDEQKSKILKAFSGFIPSKIILITSHGDDDSSNLAADFEGLLKADKILTASGIGYLNNPKNSGFYVEVRHPNAPNLQEKAFLDAMKSTGLTYKIVVFDETNRQPFIDCNFFVGPPSS